LSRLQLSRSVWTRTPAQARSLPALFITPHEVQQPEAVLRQITDLLDDANAASQRFESRNKQSGTTVALNPILLYDASWNASRFG
jgi:hypothetical protein